MIKDPRCDLVVVRCMCQPAVENDCSHRGRMHRQAVAQRESGSRIGPHTTDGLVTVCAAAYSSRARPGRREVFKEMKCDATVKKDSTDLLDLRPVLRQLVLVRHDV